MSGRLYWSSSQRATGDYGRRVSIAFDESTIVLLSSQPRQSKQGENEC